MKGPFNENIPMLEPRFSSDGKFLSASLLNYQGISIYSLEKGTWDDKIEGNGIGYQYQWSPDSRAIAFRETEYNNKRRLYKIKVYDLEEGKTIEITQEGLRNRTPPLWKNHSTIVYYDNGKRIEKKIFQRENRESMGKLAVTSFRGDNFPSLERNEFQKLNQDQRIFLNPRLLSSRNQLLVQLQGRKLMLIDLASEKEELVGSYEMAAVSPMEDFAVMAGTKDDGYHYQSSELFIYQFDTKKIEKLEGLESYMPGNPAFHRNGKTIAFENLSDSKIYLIELK